jgi:hypothetical protein
MFLRERILLLLPVFHQSFGDRKSLGVFTSEERSIPLP